MTKKKKLILLIRQFHHSKPVFFLRKMFSAPLHMYYIHTEWKHFDLHFLDITGVLRVYERFAPLPLLCERPHEVVEVFHMLE